MLVKEKNKDYSKVAKLIISIGVEYAKIIFSYLNDEDIINVIKEIIKIGEISKEERDSILKEFLEDILNKNKKVLGGYIIAKNILQKVYDENKAEEILKYINTEKSPFNFIEDIETEKILDLIKKERPQIIAIILSFISSEKGADILNKLDKERNAEVVRRMSILEKTTPDIELVETIKNILQEHLKEYVEIKINAWDKLIKVLQQIDKMKQKEIIDILEKDEPSMARIIKQQLFKFEDLKNLEDRYIQRLLREVENKDLVIALKGISEELKEKIFKNMSERGAEMIKEDLEVLGPIKRQIVEEAQQKILDVVRKLEANGEIILGGDNKDVLL